MLVSCPKCTSRYQLGDDKIKSTGTKVRCPRCQHTFKVFPQPAEAEDEVSEDRTELFIRRGETMGKAPSPVSPDREPTVTRKDSPPAASRAKTEIEPQPAKVSAQETQRSTKPKKEPSPFKKDYAETDISDPAADEGSDEVADSNSDFPGFQATPPEENQKTVSRHPFRRDPAKSDKVAAKSHAVEEHEPAVQESKLEETPAPRPFGDATFLAIQKMGSGKQGKRRALIALSLVAIVISGYFFLTRAPSDSRREAMAPASKAEAIKLNRPSRWYNDEPEVFQRFLSQMATLPPSEQTQPRNRALIAEALILNGLLSGNYDQVAQGMGFSSSLLIANPGEVYGFYGLTTNALFKEDVATLTDLVNRWPNANRSDLEFKLASMLVGSRSGQKVPAIELGKQLLQEFPNSSRVRIVTLAASIDAWNEAQQILGDRTAQDLVKDFQTKKAAIEKSGVSAPEIFNSLERKLQRKGALGGSSKPAQDTRISERNEAPRSPSQPAKEPHLESKPAKPKEKTVQKPSEESMTQRLNQRAAQKMMTGGPAPATKEATPAEPKTAPIEAKNDSLPAPGTTAPGTATAQAAPQATQPAAPAQTASKGASPAKAPPTRLPKPTEQLVAQTKQEHHEESEAAKLFRQGVSFLSANKADEAIVAFQKSLRFDPDYAESYKKLGEIYMKRQDKERALRSFKIYLQLKPDSSDKQVVEGWISSLQ